jgi:hypothetical protein
MKGILEKTTSKGWIVKDIIGEPLIKTYPLHPSNVENLEPCLLGEYGEVNFEIFKEYSNNNTNEVQVYAKISIPLLNTLKTKINSMATENFNKEIKENKEIENIVKSDTLIYKANECCVSEECACKRKAAIGFGDWLLFNNITYINSTSEGPVYKFLGFGLTIKELYELYSKKL